MQQVTINTGQGAGGGRGSIQVANFRNDFSWNPATAGPLGTLNFSASVRHISSTGYTNNLQSPHFWRPQVSQDGRAYSVLGSGLQAATDGSFQTLSWNFTDLSDWVNFQNPSLRPDFSASGSVIVFGYRFTNGVVCTGTSGFCNGTTTIGEIDNLRVELGAPQESSAVPEPSSYALALAGLAALALRRRR